MNTKGSSFMLPVDSLRKVVKPRQLNIEPEPSTRLDRQIDRLRRDEDGGGGGGAITHPFQIQDATAGGIAKINVRYGTLQDIEPTSVATDITLTDGTWTIYLDVEFDEGGTVISVTLSQATTGQPADEDYHAYITIGEVVVASDAVTEINQAVTHSLRAYACGRVPADALADPVIVFVRGIYQFWAV